MKVCGKNFLCWGGTCMNGGKCKYEKCEHWKPWTNFDKLKAMSVEEMADLLRGICPYTLRFISESQKAVGRQKCLSSTSCDDCRLNWLNLEVEE